MNTQGENKGLEFYNKEGVKVYEYETYSDGSWFESTYDKKGNILTFKDSDGYWRKHTYDKKGNKLTHKDSEGYWSERAYNKNGNQLTYKNSKGYWQKYTRDEKGNELTYENSEGTKIGFDIPEYTIKDLVKKIGNFKLIK